MVVSSSLLLWSMHKQYSNRDNNNYEMQSKGDSMEWTTPKLVVSSNDQSKTHKHAHAHENKIQKKSETTAVAWLHNYSQNACVSLEDLAATNCHVVYKSFAAIMFDFHVNRSESLHDVRWRAMCLKSVWRGGCRFIDWTKWIFCRPSIHPSIYPVIHSSILRIQSGGESPVPSNYILYVCVS